MKYNTVYAIELNNKSFIKDWNKEVRIMLGGKPIKGFFHQTALGRDTQFNRHLGPSVISNTKSGRITPPTAGIS